MPWIIRPQVQEQKKYPGPSSSPHALIEGKKPFRVSDDDNFGFGGCCLAQLITNIVVVPSNLPDNISNILYSRFFQKWLSMLNNIITYLLLINICVYLRRPLLSRSILFYLYFFTPPCHAVHLALLLVLSLRPAASCQLPSFMTDTLLIWWPPILLPLHSLTPSSVSVGCATVPISRK